MLRKMLNVLYVTNPEVYLAKDGENVVARLEDKTVFRTPVHYLEGIVTFGHLGASPALLGMCVEKGITVSMLSPHGKYLATVNGAPRGNVLLRRKQYRMADCPVETARMAGYFVVGKIAGCRTVLRRFISDHCDALDTSDVDAVCKVLSRNMIRVRESINTEEIRGIEGESARAYFSVLNKLIIKQKEHFAMQGRNRRPPLDNVNTLLSFLYTLLLHEAKSALLTVGLDPYVGFLHRDKPGRLGLALDLMEEFRPYLADRLMLSLINRKQLTESDFIKKESGAVMLKDAGRKTLLEAWQKRKAEETIHPFLKIKLNLGLLPYAQAMLLARHLRGDLTTYPPYLWK